MKRPILILAALCFWVTHTAHADQSAWLTVEIHVGKTPRVIEIDADDIEITDQFNAWIQQHINDVAPPLRYNDESVPVQVSMRVNLRDHEGVLFPIGSFIEPRPVTKKTLDRDHPLRNKWFYAFFEFILDESGVPTDIKLLNRDWFNDQETKELLQRFAEWRFKPVLVEGKPAPILQHYAWYHMPEAKHANKPGQYRAVGTYYLDESGFPIHVEVETDVFPPDKLNSVANFARGGPLIELYPAGKEHGRITSMTRTFQIPLIPAGDSVAMRFQNGFPLRGEVTARLGFSPRGTVEILGIVSETLPYEMFPLVSEKIIEKNLQLKQQSNKPGYYETSIKFSYRIPADEDPEGLQLSEIKRAPFMIHFAEDKQFVNFIEDGCSISVKYEFKVSPDGFPDRVTIVNSQEFGEEFLRYLEWYGSLFRFATLLRNGELVTSTYVLPVEMQGASESECMQ